MNCGVARDMRHIHDSYKLHLYLMVDNINVNNASVSSCSLINVQMNRFNNKANIFQEFHTFRDTNNCLIADKCVMNFVPCVTSMALIWTW
jgi:hypothetical protein